MRFDLIWDRVTMRRRCVYPSQSPLFVLKHALRGAWGAAVAEMKGIWWIRHYRVLIDLDLIGVYLKLVSPSTF